MFSLFALEVMEIFLEFFFTVVLSLICSFAVVELLSLFSSTGDGENDYTWEILRSLREELGELGKQKRGVEGKRKCQGVTSERESNFGPKSHRVSRLMQKVSPIVELCKLVGKKIEVLRSIGIGGAIWKKAREEIVAKIEQKLVDQSSEREKKVEPFEGLSDPVGIFDAIEKKVAEKSFGQSEQKSEGEKEVSRLLGLLTCLRMEHEELHPDGILAGARKKDAEERVGNTEQKLVGESSEEENEVSPFEGLVRKNVFEEVLCKIEQMLVAETFERETKRLLNELQEQIEVEPPFEINVEPEKRAGEERVGNIEQNLVGQILERNKWVAPLKLLFSSLKKQLKSFYRGLDKEIKNLEREGDSKIKNCVQGTLVAEDGFKNDDDDDDDDDWEGIEGTELERLFGSAVAFVDSMSYVDKMSRLGSDVKMQLYGLQKIVIEGPCHEPQPMAMKISARAKWNAWQQLGNLAPEEAMEKYIASLSGCIPEWESNIISVSN